VAEELIALPPAERISFRLGKGWSGKSYEAYKGERYETYRPFQADSAH
jgi:hypothetical protein